jgi:hypothetical protein
MPATRQKGHASTKKIEQHERADRVKWRQVVARGKGASERIRDDAAAYLFGEKSPITPALKEPSKDPEWLNSFRSNAATLSRQQHLEVVARVYALYAYLQGRPNYGHVIKKLADLIGKKPTKRTDALHVLVESMITYGGSTEAERKLARRLYYRDAQAIRHLISKGIPPSQAARKGSEKGQGLDAWSRRYAKSQGAQAANKPNQGYFLTLTERTADGELRKIARTELFDVTPEALKTFTNSFGSFFSLKKRKKLEERPEAFEEGEEEDDELSSAEDD